MLIKITNGEDVALGELVNDVLDELEKNKIIPEQSKRFTIDAVKGSWGKIVSQENGDIQIELVEDCVKDFISSLNKPLCLKIIRMFNMFCNLIKDLIEYSELLTKRFIDKWYKKLS